MKKFKLGLDLHGVIDDDPEYFTRETARLIEQGHEVHILTGHQESEELRAEIAATGVKFTHLYSIVSDHLERGTVVSWDDEGNPWIDSIQWDQSKAEYCKKMDIDLHIDDTKRYGRHFRWEDIRTSFIHYSTFKLIRQFFETRGKVK